MFARSVRHIMFNLVKGYDGEYMGTPCGYGYAMGVYGESIYWVCMEQITIECLLDLCDISCLTSLRGMMVSTRV